MKQIMASLLALVASTPLAAAEITGHARIVDGDTLYLDGVKIRFNGIGRAGSTPSTR